MIRLGKKQARINGHHSAGNGAVLNKDAAGITVRIKRKILSCQRLYCAGGVKDCSHPAEIGGTKKDGGLFINRTDPPPGALN